MPRYKDTDKLLQQIDSRVVATYFEERRVKNICTQLIENAPTEDVVPRSEFEALIDERDRYKKYYFRHEYDKWEVEIKQEVAKQIFEEIEHIIPKNTNGDYNDETNWLGFINHLEEILTKLQKKYIGE